MPYKLVKIKSCNGSISDSNTTYKIRSILYQNIDINHLLTNISNIHYSGDLFYGKYELPMIVDQIKTPDKSEVIPQKTTNIAESKLIHNRVFCAIYSNTKIINLKHNLYPYYFLADLIGKIPSYYIPFSLLDNNDLMIVPNSETMFINDHTTLTQPITIDYCMTYKFNCYFKDDEFIKDILKKEILEETRFNTFNLYKYSDIFKVDIEKLKLAKSIIIEHFTNKEKFQNININNIYIMIKHNNTYLNHVYLSVYIIDPKYINYVSFAEFNTNIKLDYWIHLLEKPSVDDKLSYIINTDEIFAQNNISNGYRYNFGSTSLNKYDPIKRHYHKKNLSNLEFIQKLFKLKDGQNINSIETLKCKFLKNKYHKYCDKHFLLQITMDNGDQQKYILSIKSDLFGKYKNNQILNNFDSLVKSIESNQKITHKLSPTVSQHHLKILSDIEIYCDKYIENNVDLTKKVTNETPPQSESLDTILLLTIGLIRYYVDNKDTKGNDDKYYQILKILEEIPLIYSYIVCILDNNYKSTDNFILYSRVGLGISNDLINAYKNGETINCNTVLKNGYYILGHIPKSMGESIKKAEFSELDKLIKEIRMIHDTGIKSVKIVDLTNIELDNLLKKIRSEINANSTIKQIIEKIFDTKTIYGDNIVHPLNFIDPILKSEIDHLLFNDPKLKFSDAIISDSVYPMYRTFHMHCIIDYSTYRDRYAKYLTIPSKKISYMLFRTIDFRNKNTNFIKH